MKKIEVIRASCDPDSRRPCVLFEGKEYVFVFVYSTVKEQLDAVVRSPLESAESAGSYCSTIKTETRLYTLYRVSNAVI